MIELLRHLGLNGIYIMMLGTLARLVLDTPRTVGVSAWLFQFVLITVATLVAFLSVRFLFSRWSSVAKLKGHGRINATVKASMQDTQIGIAAVGTLGILILVLLDNWDAARPMTPYNIMLVIVTFLSVAVVECLLLRYEKTQ